MPSFLSACARRLSLAGALACAVGTSAWCAPARAEEAGGAASNARRAQAKAKFEQGALEYRAGRYTQAVQLFLEADQLAPSPALSFNIARAYEGLDDPSGALRWYRDYLRRNPAATNSAEVKLRVADLARSLARSGVQQLSVLSWPDGATVIVDSRAIGITPFTGDMAPGKHRVLVSLRGYRDEVSDIQLALSAPGEAQFILKPETDQPATLRTASVAFPDADRPVAERRFGAVPWVVAGAGVVGLGSALGFELARRSEESAARRPGTSQVELQADNQAIRRDRITARVLLGAGTALLATGTVLLYFNDATPASPRVSVNCFVVGCSAQAKGHF